MPTCAEPYRAIPVQSHTYLVSHSPLVLQKAVPHAIPRVVGVARVVVFRVCVLSDHHHQSSSSTTSVVSDKMQPRAEHKSTSNGREGRAATARKGGQQRQGREGGHGEEVGRRRLVQNVAPEWL